MNLVCTSLLIVTITMVYKYRWHTLHRVICEGWINRNTVSKDDFQSIIAQYSKSTYYFIFTVWSILCTITVQNTLCVQCAGTWCMLINRENPSTGWQASLTPALSTNQVAIPALSCTTVWQHQCNGAINHYIPSLFSVLPSISRTNPAMWKKSNDNHGVFFYVSP